ncbi:MAG: DsbA family protein [Anaerolineaceae bacterium]
MGKRDIVKKHRNQKKKQDFWVILIISIIALAIIGVIVYSKLPKPIATIETTAKPQANGLNMGDPNAPVKVVEFADFQCPYCQKYWQDVEPTLLKTYIETGKVYYTYAPMAFLGQESFDSAEAAYCANDQGKFWEYRDYLYTNHTGENVGDYTEAKLVTFAKKLNLDMTAFNSCLTSGKYIQAVTDANNYATQQSVNTTPSVIVNGTLGSGFDAVKLIEDALAAK